MKSTKLWSELLRVRLSMMEVHSVARVTTSPYSASSFSQHAARVFSFDILALSAFFVMLSLSAMTLSPSSG